jgi:hypothetical protein
MTRFAVIDMNNLVNRAVHVVKATPDHREWISRSFMIVFQSIAKMSNKFMADHCVACFDSYSWREEIYRTYKENRRTDQSAKKIETKKISHFVLREFIEYLRDKTNMTVLEGSGIEADDFIARWVQRHQGTTDTNVIISNDSDFKQLVTPATDLYDPIPCILYTTDGIYFQDDRKDTDHPTSHRYGEFWKIRYSQPKTTLVYRYGFDENDRGVKGSFVYPMHFYPWAFGHRVGDLSGLDVPLRGIRIVGESAGWEYLSDTRWLPFPILAEKHPLVLHPDDRVRFIQQRETFNPSWELFFKCVRGDSRDNIRASFPRVPETRMRKAFGDNSEYVKLINDSFGNGENRQQVKPLFEMNKKLIDLTAQPPEIIERMDKVIDEMISSPPKQMVELYFEDFCHQYAVRKLVEVKANILPMISKPYRG